MCTIIWDWLTVDVCGPGLYPGIGGTRVHRQAWTMQAPALMLTENVKWKTGVTLCRPGRSGRVHRWELFVKMLKQWWSCGTAVVLSNTRIIPCCHLFFLSLNFKHFPPFTDVFLTCCRCASVFTVRQEQWLLGGTGPTVNAGDGNERTSRSREHVLLHCGIQQDHSTTRIQFIGSIIIKIKDSCSMKCFVMVIQRLMEDSLQALCRWFPLWVYGHKRKQAVKLDRDVCTLMDCLSLCGYAPLNHTVCSVV